MKILLVEDSARLARHVALGLTRAGHAVTTATDGITAAAALDGDGYDVVVLDVMIPGKDGLSLLADLRAAGNRVHVLMLTAKDTIDDRVRGLRAGADDYLVKPFAFDELLARLEALWRRQHDVKTSRLTIGPLSIDTAARRVDRAGVSVELSPREYALLEFLAVRRGRVVSRAELEERLYDGRAEIMSNAVDSAVCALRRRIDDPGAPSLIETRRGHGYLLRGPADS